MRQDWADMVADAGNNVEPAASWLQYLNNHGASDWTGGSPWLTHHPLVMYQITNASSWAQIAWNGVQQYFINGGVPFGDAINQRILLDIWVDAYDWLYNYLTPAQRTTFRNQLFKLIDSLFNGIGGGPCCDYSTYASWPMRATDTDELIHNYFSLIKVWVLTGDEDPYIYNKYLNVSNQYNVGGVVAQRTSFNAPPGGRCASGCYDESDLYPDMRTTVAAVYTKYTAGGAGWYPSGYMLEGIETYAAINWAYLRQAFGADYFPEVGEGSLVIAMRWMNLMTPDYRYIYRWADDETGYGGTDQLYSFFVTTAAVNSWFSNDLRIQYCWYIANKIAQAWPTAVGYGLQYDQFWIGFGYPRNNAGVDMTSAVVEGSFSWDIYGLGSYRTGWGPSESFFGYEWQPYHFFDHFTTSVGGFMHYRKGEWSAYQPVSYGAPTGDGEATNTMSFYTFPQPLEQLQEFKGLLAEEHGSNWAFMIGAQAGTTEPYNGTYTHVSSTFIQEYSRATLFYHGTNVDLILVFDRSHILDPSTLDYFNAQYSYWVGDNPTLAAKIKAKTVPRRQWKWHITFNPTITNNVGGQSEITWKAANSGTGTSFSGFKQSTTQSVRLSTHFTSTTYTATDEHNVPQALGWDMNSDQYGYLATEVRQTDAAWDATLHIMGITDNGFSYSTAEYASAGGQAKMAVVTLPGSDNNVLALYNVQVGPSIASPNCCGSQSSPCALANTPCIWDANNYNIIATQHFFAASVTSVSFSSVTISTATVDLFLNGLNAAHAYSFWVDGTAAFIVDSSVHSVNSGFFHYQLTGLTTTGTRTFCLEVNGTGACGTLSGSVLSATNAPIHTNVPTTLTPTGPTQNPTVSAAPIAYTGSPYTPTGAGTTHFSLGLALSAVLAYALAFLVM